MKTIPHNICATVAVAVLGAGMASTGAIAQTAPGLVTERSISLNAAMELASVALERCRADLGTPALRTRSVGEIAYYWGFNDVAHFSRSFRARYAQSPREFRSACEAARLAAH